MARPRLVERRIKVLAVSLVQRFLKEEGAGYVRTAVDKLDASASLVEVNFNVFDLVVDFEKQVVQVTDSLDVTLSEEMPLAQFRLLLAP